MIFQNLDKEGITALSSLVYSVSSTSFDSISQYVLNEINFKNSHNFQKNIYLNPGLNSKVYVKDLQVYEVALSLEYFMKTRMLSGLDPLEMKKRKLLLYFRFDESAGQKYLLDSSY